MILRKHLRKAPGPGGAATPSIARDRQILLPAVYYATASPAPSISTTSTTLMLLNLQIPKNDNSLPVTQKVGVLLSSSSDMKAFDKIGECHVLKTKKQTNDKRV